MTRAWTSPSPSSPSDWTGRPPTILFLTGLDARERAPETISATAAILDHLGCDWTAFTLEHDPGLDLWELGYTEAADAAAARFAAEVTKLRPARIVTGSSRVLRALREPLPAALAGLPEVEHISEFLASRVSVLEDAAETTPRVATDRVAYHDPCSLGRRARVFDAPAAVIEATTGLPVLEFFHSREIAECCGDGGLLPEVDPELAERLASRSVGAVAGRRGDPRHRVPRLPCPARGRGRARRRKRRGDRSQRVGRGAPWTQLGPGILGPGDGVDEAPELSGR